MTARPVVAVVPFGARAGGPVSGAWARQLARRLVDRFAGEPALELRPVFLVAMPEATSDAGYLVFGSSPAPDLAAGYAESLGASHALTATLREEGAGRALDLVLVEVRSRQAAATTTLDIPAGTLHEVEPRVAAWLASVLDITPVTDVSTPVVATEPAYAALLEAMDEEVNATLLRESDRAGANAALQRALAGHLTAARADPHSALPEERILVLALEALERGVMTHEIAALEELSGARPQSWRAHYILGQLRAESGDTNSAIVAFEHAHAVRALPDHDVVRLAELYANAGSVAPARAHLRHIGATSPAYGAAQELLAIIAFQRGDLAAGEEAFGRAVGAGTTSWELHAAFGAARHARGETAEAAARYRDALAAGGPAVVRLNLARVLLAMADREGALRELDTLLGAERSGEVAGHARRLRFGIAAPDLERELEGAGQAALAGDVAGLDLAAAVFERALATDPDLWEAHFGLGIIGRQRADGPAAERAFRRVLELWPDQPDALHELGVALLTQGDAAGALSALDRAAALRPDDPAYLADAGFAHLRAGDLSTARLQLERAATLDAGDPITRSYLDELGRTQAGAGETP